MTEYDIGIRCSHVLTMAQGLGHAKNVFIGIRGSKIAVIEPLASPEKAVSQRAAKIIDASHHVVMPGLINSHTHLPMTLLRGLADDQPLADWLYKSILPAESRCVNEDFVRVGTELAAWELIRTGTTTACDMYYFEDVVAEVLDRVGLRGVLAEAVLDFPCPDDPLDQATKTKRGNNWKILDRMVERYSRHERITPAVGPHAPYTCGDENFKKARDYSAKHGLPVVVHVAETEHEINESLKQHNKSPVERIQQLGVMERPCIFAHCVHVSPKDMELMRKAGVSAIYNPESNMKLSSGAAPIPQLLQAGITVGIGTDGAASNNDLSLFREMDTGAKLQKLSQADNTAMTAEGALRMATIEGARALGLEKVTGSLELGKYADIIAVDLRHPHLMPLHDRSSALASALVYSANGSEVAHVLCHGRVLMEEGHVLTLDCSALTREVARCREKVEQALQKG